MRTTRRLLFLVCACLVAVDAAAQPAPEVRPSATAPAETSPAVDPHLDRIRRGLDEKPSALDDSLAELKASDGVTFRVSVTQRSVDLAAFLGNANNAVAAYVQPSGGAWHHEFRQMTTPDMFKGFANLGNSERLQLMASSGAFAAVMALLQTGVRAIRDAADERARGQAREQVRQELEEFLRQHAIPPPSK